MPFAATPIVWPDNSEDSFNGPDYNENRTINVTVPVPSQTKRVIIVAIISGHGGCEFVPTSHSFLVNGQSFNTTTVAYDRFMLAGSAEGCTKQVKYGSIPNEHGTWYYGRNGWCDGQDIPPLEWDVTKALAGGDVTAMPKIFQISYKALSYAVGGGLPSEGGCGGHIIMNAQVAFYSS